MLSSYKQDIIWPDAGGLDASALIPYELGGTMQQPVKPVVSVMDLGKMLLHCAREGETEQVRDLMSRGAPFTTDWLGTSPLHVAATNNHHDTCDALIKAGIGKNARTKVDRTPLHFAAYEGHVEIVRLLLAHECEVDAKDMLRMTPLHWAVEKRHPRIVELLLRHGADPSGRSKFDKTPLSIALETMQPDVYQELLAAKLKIGDPEQQQATDGLMFELSRTRATSGGSSGGANVIEDGEMVEVEPELTHQQHTVESMHVDEGNYGSSTMPSPIYSSTGSDHLSDQDRLNANGIEIDESMSKLPSADGCKGVDTSTLQILKDHGIAMLEDTDGTLLNSALQSGRRLVLSDAGKLILNDPKYKTAMVSRPTVTPVASTVITATTTPLAVPSNSTSPLKKQTFVPVPAVANHHTGLVIGGNHPNRFEALRKKPTIFMPSKSTIGGGGVGASLGVNVTATNTSSAAALPLKTNKVIKILSAEEFKQMCGANAAAGSTLKKISTESFQKGALKYQTISNTNILTQLTRKKPILNKIKLGTLTQATKSTMLNEIKITGIKPIGHHQLQKLVPSTSTTPAAALPANIHPAAAAHSSGNAVASTSSTLAGVVLDPDTEYISRLSQNQAKAAAAAAAAAASSQVYQRTPGPVMAPAMTTASATIGGTTVTGGTQTPRVPLSHSEMERLLYELRKQTDELRKQFELSQKQSEEYRVRLEKLERERDEDREERYQQYAHS